MDRRYVLGTVAAFTAACATQLPHTAALNADYWLKERGPVRPVSLLSYDRTVAAWQLPPQNPWAPYAKFTLLTALTALKDSGEPVELPEVSKLITVNNAVAAAAQLASTGLPDDAMWVVDLRGPAAVAFGSYLSLHTPSPVSVVPTFNNWPADNELVPAEETLAALLTMPPQPPPQDAQASVPVFLLDAWRLAFRNEDIEEDVVDNRYYLNPADLPDAQHLREQGIRRIVYVVELRADVETEEDDLNSIFLSYQQAGITVHVVDLELLAGRSPEVPWATVLAQTELAVAPRPTLLYDTGFYLRARGGFGGLHARPHGLGHRYGVHRSVFHFGHGGHGGHRSGFGGHGGHRGGWHFGGHRGG